MEQSTKTDPHRGLLEILTKVPRQFNEERIIFSISGAGVMGYPHAKK